MADLDPQPLDALSQASSASVSTTSAKQNPSRRRLQLPVLPGSERDAGLAAALPDSAGTRTRADSYTAAVRRNNLPDIFSAPRSRDGTLDFSIDPAFLTAGTSSFDADEIFNNAVRERDYFHSAFSTGRVQGPTAVAVGTCMEAGGPPAGFPPITPPPLTTARTPSARGARRMARNASNPAVQALTSHSAPQVSVSNSAVQAFAALSVAASAAPSPAAKYLMQAMLHKYLLHTLLYKVVLHFRLLPLHKFLMHAMLPKFLLHTLLYKVILHFRLLPLYKFMMHAMLHNFLLHTML